MPENKNFNILSETVNVVYPTAGVFLGGGSEEFRDAMLGAYYDSSEESKGLYVALVSGAVKYYDIDAAEVFPQGDPAIMRFSIGEADYLFRPLYSEDGQWLSKYGVDLPKEVLERKIALDGFSALEKFTGIELGDPLSYFEAMYLYFTESNPNVVSIDYASSYGNYSRRDGQWELSDIEIGLYDDLLAVEIKQNKAKEIVDLYDANKGKLLVKDTIDATFQLTDNSE